MSATKVGLVDMLKIGGFDESLPTKLVRHQDRRYPGLRQRDWLELYQSYQSQPRFHSAKQIVSFYGLPGTRAAFFGVYKVLGWRPASKGRTLDSCEWSRLWKRTSQFFYNLERDTRFDDLCDRLVIDWGVGTLAWVQRLDNKALLEVLETGRKLPSFTDYLEFSLTYAELRDLFSNEEAHRDWKAALSAVAGVYLVLAEKSGHLYVGSASGTEGIWGRWRNYARSRDGAGGNKKLRALAADDSRYPGSFRFSVLQILPKSMAHSEVVHREERYKEKLGSKATGLNSN